VQRAVSTRAQAAEGELLGHPRSGQLVEDRADVVDAPGFVEAVVSQQLGLVSIRLADAGEIESHGRDAARGPASPQLDPAPIGTRVRERSGAEKHDPQRRARARGRTRGHAEDVAVA
jgi:hypothetical protein